MASIILFILNFTIDILAGYIIANIVRTFKIARALSKTKTMIAEQRERIREIKLSAETGKITEEKAEDLIDASSDIHATIDGRLQVIDELTYFMF